MANYSMGVASGSPLPTQITPFIQNTYQPGTNLVLPVYDIIANNKYIRWHYFYDYLPSVNFDYFNLTLSVKADDKVVASGYIRKVFSDSNLEWRYYDKDYNQLTQLEISLILEEHKTYSITYKFEHLQGGSVLHSASMVYYFSVVNNVLPLKKWTITDVINRIFDTVEPLVNDDKFKNNKPRFRLKQDQAEKYDKILSPEFTFTQMTLRERLNQVGGFIHAEPRITRKVETADDEYWEVAFDEYGSNEISNISKKEYISAGYKTNINDYCTSLDSSAQNLINVLDYAQGVTFEPFYSSEESGKGISLRTENTTMRISEDDSSFIPTSYNIYQFKGTNQVRISYIPDIGEGNWDITPYIFEKTDYDSILDSFAGVYPYSKSYALYYTQGSKNIYGLFFKAPHRTSGALEPYAINKILSAVTGQTINLSLEKLSKVRFCISYLPISNARIRTSKQTILGGLPSTIAYNQGANNIETSYYGENLKGVVERLGNIEKTYTYHLAFLSDIPKVGTLFDKDYYISTVSTEILPQYIRCTIGLSKDFNRLSEYVGISSNKRMWEISEKMSQERQSVFTEYLVIKRNYTPDGSDIKGHWNLPVLRSLFYQSSPEKPINLVEVSAKDKKGNNISTICLPVISMALGNSILFTFNFQDNYSAGQKIEETQIDNKTSLWANYVSYTDFYGRIYYFDMNFISGEPKFIESNTNEYVAKNFPLVDISADSQNHIAIINYKYRKDSREYPQITYELCAVAEDESLIIGSALMKNCKLVNINNINSLYKVYGFKEKLNKFTNKIDISNGIEIGEISASNNINITLPNYNGTETFNSWAIVTPPKIISEQVEDEDGKVTTQQIDLGSELVLGANGEYVSGEKIGFIVKGIRDIYQI